jgi:hypothetical protein
MRSDRRNPGRGISEVGLASGPLALLAIALPPHSVPPVQ